MEINKSINTSIITDNNLSILDLFRGEKIITNIDDIKTNTSKFVIFNDCLRYLKNADLKRLLSMLEKNNIHFLNITSNIEEVIYTPYLIVYTSGSIQVEGDTVSVLKEEKILKRLGFRLPFIFDVSLQLNYYGLLNSVSFEAKGLVDKLW